eukprot:2840150-Amphidinium_carterae.1
MLASIGTLIGQEDACKQKGPFYVKVEAILSKLPTPLLFILIKAFGSCGCKFATNYLRNGRVNVSATVTNVCKNGSSLCRSTYNFAIDTESVTAFHGRSEAALDQMSICTSRLPGLTHFHWICQFLTECLCCYCCFQGLGTKMSADQQYQHPPDGNELVGYGVVARS